MLIYSDRAVNENKNTRRSSEPSIRNSVTEPKTSKSERKKLSKKNVNFLVSLGFKLKKK